MYAALDAMAPAIDGAADDGIIPGIPPIIPIPAPAGNALTPQRQSHMHWPLFIVPIPGTMLALAIGVVVEELIGIDIVFEELIGIDIIMDDVVAPPMVSMALHAMSLSLGALMLKRMPRWQWSAWPQNIPEDKY